MNLIAINLKNKSIPIPNHHIGKLPLKKTLIMGILNITPDSFSDGGKFYHRRHAVNHALKMAESGADIIDIGGESTRPGAQKVKLIEELKRVIPTIETIIKLQPDTIISIDTYKSKVAEAAIKAGARIINDISGLTFDSKMVDIALKYKTPVVIMHIKGTPRNMQNKPCYKNIISEIKEYFRERIALTLSKGISKNQIIIDPGIGFGKRIEDNYIILKRLSELKTLGYPILVGPSRKSFIGATLNLVPEKRLLGTAASVAISILNGANIVRVHDVSEMKQVATICDNIIK
ncbi:MAG: dihydropteroate synthase [Candidatus Brocadiia bacterium]